VKQSELLDTIVTVIGSGTRPKSAKPPPRTSARSAKKLRILLAEDNPVNQTIAVHLLKRKGHSVQVAGNGREAVVLARRKTFDVILMDVQMPEMDGLEATAAIRLEEKDRGARVPIVAMTAHALKGDREKCLAAGMDHYVTKPVQETELLQAIERATAGTARAKTATPSDAAILTRFGGDRKLIRSLRAVFAAESPKQMAAIEKAVRIRDADSLRLAAHALRGSAGNFTTAGAYEKAAALEAMARQGDLAAAPAVYRDLQKEMARLKRVLNAVAARPAKRT
jgi:CheY-like chemotaxis protein